jgi:polar amino acid transport system substrate-binding protein
MFIAAHELSAGRIFRMRHRLLPILLGCAAAGAGAQTLTLHYQDRPPYSSAAGGGAVAGLVAAPAEQALRRAGIAYTWVLTPSQRQLALIQQGRGLDCGLGWYRNAERAALGKFSAPLYRDEPFAAIARAGVLAPGGPPTAREALASASGSLLIKEGYSYGEYLDGLIAKARVAPQRVPVEPLQMLRMVAAGRAGWMVATPEEAAVMLAALGPEAGALQLARFSDVPPGQTRHLYCNHAVPDEWLARIDRALALPGR